MSKYLFLLTTALLPTPVWAQSDPGDAALAETLRYEEEQAGTATPPPASGAAAGVETGREITVTATGLGTDIANTGQAVTLIGRDEIEAVQGADLARVLRRAPSLSISRSGPVGGLTSVSVRGASNDQLLVLIDGVRVADPASPGGGFDFGTLTTGNVGKLDLLRGSNSTIWGSDAVGGVLEVSTRREAGLEGSVEYGARDTLFGNAVAGLESGSLFASLSGAYYRSDGISAAASGTEIDGFEQGSVAGSAFFDITPALEAFAHGRYATGELEIDGFAAPTFQLADTPETQETEQVSGAVGLAYYGTDLTLRGFYSLADTQRDNFAAPDAAEPSFASDGRSERISLRGEYRLIGGLSLALGGEHEWTEYETTFADPAETEITGVYGQLGWVFGPLAIHAGARLDDHRDFGSEWSFGGDASYRIGGDWRVKASIGEGFKAPTLFQLFSAIGNPDLRPERSLSYDLGVARGSRADPFHVALTAFRRDSEDLIDFAFVPDNPFGGSYFNVGEARAQGVELELGARPSERLSVSAVYALIDTEDRTDGAANAGNDLARRPRHALTVFADWVTPLAGLTLGGDVRLVGDSFDNAANTRTLDGHVVADLRASLPVGERLELFGGVENLFDVEYQTVLGYGQPGRGAFVGVRVRR